mmetsp:Transcript_4548/g.8285  ORF Transcript_4548/g.8285 Transcript_4548/m.8285 type:complete len:488 (+) Transcript_4548:361-1824(+)|eukprot:CAMPEP_0197532068 /NCGR_PEP_ID=MMETSP1318-20131121/38360_1 /TAXON_ID=552666 /ORGANISM="Partenskyella glossopodia, Strain RCC365" /LENGTH=487 /DNA_ID=CAMNT_0043088509 /DNA_START=152 /DNA_END=1615 /DNA_ORIENTATION=-
MPPLPPATVGLAPGLATAASAASLPQLHLPPVPSSSGFDGAAEGKSRLVYSSPIGGRRSTDAASVQSRGHGGLGSAAGPGGGAAESSSDSSDSEDELGDGRRKFVLHVDDEADEDTMAVLLEPTMHEFLNTPLASGELADRNTFGDSLKLLTFIRRVRWKDVPSHKLNQKLAQVFQDLYASLLYKSKGFACNIKSQLNIPEENEIEIVLMAVAMPAYARYKRLLKWMGAVSPRPERVGSLPVGSASLSFDQKKQFGTSVLLDEKLKKNTAEHAGLGLPAHRSGSLFAPPHTGTHTGSMHTRKGGGGGSFTLGASGSMVGGVSLVDMRRRAGEPGPGPSGENLLPIYKGDILTGGGDILNLLGKEPNPNQRLGSGGGTERDQRSNVLLTTLERLPTRAVESYLGRVSVHIIRESFEEKRGTLARFTHELLAQINTIAKAHVAAKGGNAMLSYALLEYQVDQETTRQSYSIMSLSGDAVLLADRNKSDS